jgi:hypothetical protein
MFGFCFPAEIGGWLGLVLGASIVSLGEIIFFSFLFCKLGFAYIQQPFMTNKVKRLKTQGK